jgi:hypothetical protein
VCRASVSSDDRVEIVRLGKIERKLRRQANSRQRTAQHDLSAS